MSDIKIIWAIRDTPSTVLNSQEKLILCMLWACIGENGFTWHSQKSLSEICSISSRRLYLHILSLEQKSFISIKRPEHYTHAKSNEYRLNVDHILSYFKYQERMKSPDETSGDIQSRQTKRPKSPDETSDGRQTKRLNKYKIEDIKEERAREMPLVGALSCSEEPPLWMSKLNSVVNSLKKDAVDEK